MDTHIRNFIRAFRNFIRAFGVRWFVAMSGGLGVPLTVASFFLSGDAAKIILFVTGVACAIFSSYWVWNEEHVARLKAEAIVYHPFIDIKHSQIFLDPPRNESWKAIITFIRETSLQVCLTIETYPGGIGFHDWGDRRRWTLRKLVDVAEGERLSIDLMALDNSSPTRFWRWAAATADVNTLVCQTCHRCQLVFMPQKGPYDYFDFYVTFHDRTPSLAGEHLFLYAREWRNEDATKAHS